MTSRRTFLQQASAAGIGLLAQFSGPRLWALAPVELLPEPDESLMRELSLAAVEAARAAGADFADIRLVVGRAVSVGCLITPLRDTRPTMVQPSLTLAGGYGVRAIVDGAWGFASGVDLTVDAVVTVARRAVAGARINRPQRPRILELAPAPRVTNGLWETVMERDPLTVPLGEQRDLALSALGSLGSQSAVSSAQLNFSWRRPTTVFATTDGTCIIQRFSTAVPTGSVSARVGEGRWGRASVGVDGLRMGGYGYEAVGAATLASEVREAGKRALALAQAARAPVSAEVGRYDLVFGPGAVTNLLIQMAGALDLERVLGYDANGAGTSFAAPPAEILGRYQIASQLVSVRADRTQPYGGATVGWDEEGVKPEPYTIVQDGIVVDYHTNRQTAMEVGDWYSSRGKPVRAHGCTRRTGTALPEVLIPNLTIEPAKGMVTRDDLIADTKRGFYIASADGGVDQQMLNAQYGVAHTQVRRITNGKLGGYVRDLAFQFITPAFWKRVDGLGGAATAVSQAAVTDRSALMNPLYPFPFSTIRTVPMRVRDVNVLNTGRVA